MATYTMELRTLANSPYHEVFDFDYPFYCDDNNTKKEFEELFINRFYFHEIGAETVDRWKHMLKTRLYLKMPYYKQLYLTEWERTGKDMMQSKDLTETTIHTLTSNDTTNGTMNSTSSANASDTSSGNVEGGTQTDESYIADGVGIVNLDANNKTGTSSANSTTTSSSSGESESNATSQSTNSNTNELKLEEKTTFSSSGDIGIQTPAYAITEWRKVIINLNEMLLNEFEDLFIQIY